MPRGGNFRRYSEEFKQTAIELALSGTKPIVQVAKELDMSDKTLHSWLRQHRQNHPITPTISGDGETQEQELKRLRKEVRDLKMERDILKKATAYFARETK